MPDLGDLVLDFQFLALEMVKVHVVGVGPVALFVDGLFQAGMFGLEGLDAFMDTHALRSLLLRIGCGQGPIDIKYVGLRQPLAKTQDG